MEIKKSPIIEALFKAGAHFGFSRSRRHPTTSKFIFGTKNSTDIFDLEKTQDLLGKATAFLASLGKEGKTILFVGGKSEARAAVRSAAESLGMPFVDGRWIGGTFTNFSEIRRRVDTYERLMSEREKGELSKYTKRERLLIDKEIASLESMFAGIVSLKEMPKAVILIDPREEKNAVAEAIHAKIPLVALAGSDCDLDLIDHPVAGNDASRASIQYFLNEMVKAYQEGKKSAVKA